MRLIDADKLLKFFTVDTANQTYRFGTVKKQIESAPTVQAISLDKVKQAREEMKDKSCYGCLQIMDKLIESEEVNE